MENFEQLHNEIIIQNNKELIDKIRQQSNKPKKRRDWVTPAWVVGMVALTIAIIIALAFALRPIQRDGIETTINVTLESEDPNANRANLKNLKFPEDKVNYKLFISNNKQKLTGIYLRFYAKTYIEDKEANNNILLFVIPSELKDYIYYHEESDVWYYIGELPVDGKIQICSQIQISGEKADNDFSQKTLSFSIIVDAVRANPASIWPDVPQEWIDAMNNI